MKKTIIFFFVFLTPIVVSAGVLDTRNYEVTITQNCEEGNVTCDNVTYKGISKKSGKNIILKGTTLHSKCADGVTPCRFQGYEFKNGDITYRVLEEGVLQVIRNNKELLIEEKGTWK